jgi:hypothetical protein
LLDWLASSFGGVTPEPSESATLRPWSLKSLIRELALSRTYRMRSDPSDTAREIDPENRLISHATRKRLTAEQLRDAMLAISGQLQLEPPRGPTFPATQAADYNFVASDPRRSVYLPVFRNALPEFFSVFDFPPTSMVTGQRSESTVPTQALFLLNDPFVREQAEATQRRLLGPSPTTAHDPAGTDTTGAGPDPIVQTYRWTLGRPPSPGEAQTLRAYLSTSEDPVTAWADIVQALFASADFRLLN